MELKEFVTLYRRWFWLLIAGLGFGLVCGFVISMVQTPLYEASTKVLVARNRQQGSADILSLTDQQLVATYQQLLKTQPITDEVASRLGIKIDPDNVRAVILPNTQIIQITVRDGNAGQAVTIANSLVQILIDRNETLQAGRYAAYGDGLDVQIAQVQKQIADLQNQITEIDQANIKDQLAQVDQQINVLQDQIVALETDIARSPEAISGIARASLAEKQGQLIQLRSLLSLYQEIKANLIFIGKPIQAASIQTDPQITSLQSTLNLYQQLYLNLLNNAEAVKLARFQSTPTVTQIEEAVIPKTPVRPLPLLYTALAALVGFFLAAGAILLIDYFNEPFNTTQKVQEFLHAPVIGQIAEARPVRKWYQRSARPDDDHVQLDNAFGSLRINLNRLLAGSSRSTVLITSPWRREGKTTVASNLARSLAQSGKRVVLVDADLHHPQIHARFNLDNQIGLIDILSGGVDWQEVSSAQDKVTVITSGIMQPGQSALLESGKFTELLERLQRKADIVILDGPPLFTLDAQVLASKVAGVLLVIRQGETRKSVARSMKEQLGLMDINLLGVVMNGVPRTEAYYFEGYAAQIQQKTPKEAVEEKAKEVEPN